MHHCVCCCFFVCFFCFCFVVCLLLFCCCCFFVKIIFLFSDGHIPEANITEICICYISLKSYISDFLLMALNIVHILDVIEKRKIPPAVRKMDDMVRDLF